MAGAIEVGVFRSGLERPQCSQGGIVSRSRRGSLGRSGGLYVMKFSVLKAEFQYPAFVGLVMYLCEIDL